MRIMPPAVWLLVAAAASSISLALGVRQTFGLFLLPLASEAGLSRSIFLPFPGKIRRIWHLA